MHSSHHLFSTVEAEAGVAARQESAAPAFGSTAGVPDWLWRLLVVTALLDWLVTRTAARFAIFMPKTPAMVVGYQALTWLGQAASTVAALTAWLCAGYLVVAAWRTGRGRVLATLGAALAVLSLVAPFLAPARWLPGYYLLALAVLLALTVHILRTQASRVARLAVLLPALAMVAAVLYQAAPTFYAIMHWPGPPTWGLPLFRAGEMLVVLGAGLLWWVYGRGADRRSWLYGGIPALLFGVGYLAAPAMTATIAIWSHGVTLSLPWWSYAAALWLVGVTVAWNLRGGRRAVAWGLLLLVAAGYAPQLSSQYWFGVLALWLLVETACAADWAPAA